SICRPEPKKRDTSCGEKCRISAVSVGAADHEYYSRQKQVGCKGKADPRFCRSGSHILRLGALCRFNSRTARTARHNGPPHLEGLSPALKQSTAKSRGE